MVSKCRHTCTCIESTTSRASFRFLRLVCARQHHGDLRTRLAKPTTSHYVPTYCRVCFHLCVSCATEEGMPVQRVGLPFVKRCTSGTPSVKNTYTYPSALLSRNPHPRHRSQYTACRPQPGSTHTRRASPFWPTSTVNACTGARDERTVTTYVMMRRSQLDFLKCGSAYKKYTVCDATWTRQSRATA